MNPTFEPPVPALVVGGGPTGLMMAILLARHGVPSIIVERATTRLGAPKAHVVNPRSLEICRAADLDVDAMIALAASPDDDRWSYFMTRLSDRELGRLPFEAHDDEFTPFPRINLAQPKLEQLLEEEAARTALIELRRGHEWRMSAEDDDGVLSTVAGPDGEYALRSSYVIAADGAASPVRAELGIAMHGQPDVLRCLTIHFEGSLRDVVAERPGLVYWTLRAATPGIFLAYDIDRTWVYFLFGAPDHAVSIDEARSIVIDAIGRDDVDFEVRHVLPWTMTAQVADRYQHGRIFLMGDAAHRFPPAGGLGLNTGIQDAHNLAWKVAAVVHGWADPSFLESYERERRPVAQMNTDQSLKNAGDVMTVLTLPPDAPQDDVDAAIRGMFDNFNSLALQLGFSYAPDAAPPAHVPTYVPSAGVGERMPHAWITVDGARQSTLDLLSPTSYTLLVGSAGHSWSDAVTDVGAPVGVVTIPHASAFDRPWPELIGVIGTGAVLVRPDGHIAFRAGDDSEASRLAARQSVNASRTSARS